MRLSVGREPSDRPGARVTLAAVALGGGVALAPAALVVDADDVPDEPDTGEQSDDERRGVGLTPTEPVTGRSGEGMMVVVPGLAEGGQRKPEQVARVILGGIV